CPKCGNSVPKNQKICIYCQSPLSRSDSKVQNKQKLVLRYFIPLVFLAMAIRSLPDIVRLFRGDTKTASSVSQPAPKTPPIEENKPTQEISALVAYKKLTNAIERGDEETARRYINNAKWNQMELEQENPSAIKALDAACPVDTKFESHDLEDRAVITGSGKSTQVRDDDSKPSSTVLIAKMAQEDEQWKVFSVTCHIRPPADYMEEALTWLYEQPSSGDDLSSRLVANGLPDGEVSCFMAVKYGKPKAVKRCLEAGWSVDAEDSDGRKAIDLALAKMEYATPENNEVIELFVKEGANINRPNSEGMTPLMLAAIHCNEEAAKAFIDAGADMDYKTPDGITSSKLAENCPKVTKLLRAVRP
ncbi:ankyrin repeat domain-containing protein, partial [bacterium]|nr:ankyrin repeat domain-containing protein [bacterium]